MIQAQEEILDVCDKLHKITEEASLADDKTKRVEEIQESVASQKLLVPIVGEFSSGKSTMINTMLKESVLPVGITPETSLATELHYSEGEQFAEGIMNDGSTKKYEISQINELTIDAEKFRSAQVYLKNQALKEIEPLVLVDMPGFSAPKEQHNKAIAEYLDKGIYYIVLAKITDGTVSRSLMNRLREINSFGRKFSLFLSNADLVQVEKAREVCSACEDSLYSEFGEEIKVSTINNTDVESVKKCLSNVNPNILFKNLYYYATNEICNGILDGLNCQIKAAKIDADQIRKAEEEIKKSIEKIKATSESAIQNMKNRYSGTMVQNIINDVGDALNNSCGEIVSAAMSKSNVEHLINEIVRSALVQSMQRRIGEANDSIVSDFSDSVTNLSEILRNLDIDLNYTDKIVGTLQDSFKTLMTFMPTGEKESSMGDFAVSAGLAGLGTGLSKVLAAPATSIVSGITGVVATALNPILGVVIAILPSILGGLFGLGKQKAQNDNAESQIRSKLIGEVFPQIKNKLRMELPGILQEQVSKMIAKVRSQYEQMLSSQQQELEKAIQNKTESEQESKENLGKLEKLRDEVKSCLEKIITWRIA